MTLPRSGFSSWISMAALAASIALLLIPLTGRTGALPCKWPRARRGRHAARPQPAPRAPRADHSWTMAVTPRVPAPTPSRPSTNARYPGDTITVAQMEAARAASRPLAGPAVPGRQGAARHLGQRRAKSGPLPVTPSSAARSAMSRTTTYAGGRTTSIAISDTCDPGALRDLHHARGWRRLADEERAHRSAELGVPRRAARYQRRRVRDHRSRTIRRATRSTSARARPTSAARAASRASGLYKSTDGGDTWTGPLGQAELGGKGIGAIVVKPGDSNTLLRGHHHGAARHVVGLLLGRDATRARRGAVGPVQVHRRGRHMGLHPQRRGDNAAACTGDLTEYNNGGACSPRGVRARRRSIHPTPTSSTPARTRAASGGRTTAGRPGRRSSRPSTPR